MTRLVNEFDEVIEDNPTVLALGIVYDLEEDTYSGKVDCWRGDVDCEIEFFDFELNTGSLIVSQKTPIGNYTLELTLTDQNPILPRNQTYQFDLIVNNTRVSNFFEGRD